MRKPRVLCVWGTRPEAIKMAPVVFAMRRERQLSVRTCVTAQHRDLLDQALQALSIRPDHDLDLMRPDQTLEQTTARVLEGVAEVLRREAPDLVLVQGDTTTALASTLAAFYRGIPVGHVEAGLRSHDALNPFPEEMNRVLADDLSILHLAPTPLAKRNLLREGVPAKGVRVTGNTVVDALRLVRPRPPSDARLSRAVRGGRLVLVTAHRRESFGRPLRAICRALETIAESFPDVRLVYPVHPNPAVKRAVARLRHPRIVLTEPVAYGQFLHLLQRSCLVMTDSGGIQEEAPSFGIPVVVMREVTERPEAVRAGAAVLAGTDEHRIARAASRILSDPALHRRMACVPNPFGDGRASGRIVKAVLHHFGLGSRPADWRPG